MFLWYVAAAHAHTPGLSYARIEPDALVLTFSEAELADRWSVDDPALASRILAQTTLAVDGAGCLVGEATVRRVEADGVEIRAPSACPTGPWTYAADHLALLADGHRQAVDVLGAPVAVLDRDRPALTTSEGAEGSVAARFLGLGVEHIVTGWDHLAFLLALLLATRTYRDMAVVVTGFTVAHSITLSAATLGLVTLPAAVVEPLIALSIAAVGLENLLDPPPGRRFAVTLLLGLVHGFGFAGMLAELGLPTGSAALALVAFNVGVELGQLAIVLPVLPVLLALRRRPAWVARGVPVASVLVALAGAWWFLERI